MHYFFDSECDINTTSLPKDEMTHAIKALRLSEGDEIGVLNGNGDCFVGVIEEISRRNMQFILNESIHVDRRKPFLHIGLSPLKNNDRFEWFVEKATEIGVAEITPVICKRTVRHQIKPERLQKISISALKQSGNRYLPKINPMCTFEEFIGISTFSKKFIGHCMSSDKVKIKDIPFQNNTVILIGPEGDFEEGEVELASQSAFQSLDLGQQILRAETAAISASVFFEQMK